MSKGSIRARWVAAGRVVGLLAAALLLAACGEPETASVSTAAVAHPWVNPPRVSDPQSVTLPGWLVYRVAPAAMAEAVKELEREAYIQISPSMAKHYAQAEVSVPMEMRPFLIRALDTGSSEISVVQSMQGLWTRTIGGADAVPHEQPLVVLVDPTPVDIFVTVEAAPPPADDG